MNPVIVPLIVALVTAVLSVLTRKTRLRDYISFAGSTLYSISVASLLLEVMKAPVSYQAGGWPAPFGITLVADSLTVFMLVLTSVVYFTVNLYSWSFIRDRGKESGYYAFLNFMVAGMTGAFLAGDLFNLFVMFEIVLMSSYALVAFKGDKRSLFTSLKYVVLNLIGSSLMLVAIGGFYSVTGTLNLADMHLVLSEGAVNMVPVLGLSAVLFCVFGIKSGLVPFHFWAPTVYSNSPAPVSAIMSGVSKKIGIYAVIRIYLTVLSGTSIPAGASLFAGQPVNSVLGTVVAVMGTATVVIGGLSAVNRDEIDRILSYSSVGQVGFIFLPISMAMLTGSRSALTAALIYIMSHGVAKPALFMISGLIEKAADTTDITKLSGLSDNSLPLSAAFSISAISLIGIPPLLGFFAKLNIFRVFIGSSNPLMLLVALIGSITTLLYFSRAWLEAFFGEPLREFESSEISTKELAAIMLLACLIILTGLGFEPVYNLSESAAEAALNPEVYVETVLGDIK
jgi:multicomponent Na+:H+ antiporter subunit D